VESALSRVVVAALLASAHFAFFLDHYRKGEYREALAVQRKMNVPNN
jgi:hypothetical protein